MNKQELIKNLEKSAPLAHRRYVETVVSGVEAEGWLRNPGEPIDPEDIREGDRYRVVYEDGDEHVVVAEGPRGRGLHGAKYFLLDRPKPELPTEPGSVIKDRLETLFTLGKDGTWRDGMFPYTPEKFDGIDWEVVA